MDRMTPHTPVDTLESIVAELRQSPTMSQFYSSADLASALLRERAELADRLASLPVEGWRTMDGDAMVGTMLECDFTKDTLTFHMTGPYRVAAGRYTIEPEGERRDFVRVPREPNDLMLAHGFECDEFIALMDDVTVEKRWPYSCREAAELVGAIYRAMLAAAPQDQRQGNEQGGPHE